MWKSLVLLDRNLNLKMLQNSLQNICKTKYAKSNKYKILQFKSAKSVLKKLSSKEDVSKTTISKQNC